MLPDLDSLALLVRAAEMKNLTRASEASLITVPAASRRLSLLEHQFKTTLFERHSRGLELTPAGERLLLAREVIASVHHMRAQMGNYAKGKQSVLRVHGNTSAMTQFLPGDIASFSAAHEDVRVVLEECWSEDAVRKVRSGEVDLAVIVEGPDVRGLHVAPYRHDRLAAVMRNDDALCGRTPLHFAELLDRDLVGLEGSSTLTRLLEAQAALLLRPVALRVQVRSFESVCRAVEARLGVGVLPLAAARSFAGAMGLTVEPLADAWALRAMRLCTRLKPEATSALGALVGHLEGLAD
jgi:DNA-binding transcriptional LysR family regulator